MKGILLNFKRKNSIISAGLPPGYAACLLDDWSLPMQSCGLGGSNPDQLCSTAMAVSGEGGMGRTLQLGAATRPPQSEAVEKALTSPWSGKEVRIVPWMGLC